jgi:hypothetical protein
MTRSPDVDYVVQATSDPAAADFTIQAIGGGSTVETGAGNPSSTPSAVGDHYIDTTGPVIWVAGGTSSSADWVQVSGLGGGDLLSTNNLNDVANASTSRSNLGLAIGTDVQAWSAVLDATTASFTIADETKLDNIEANADVTDTANVTAAGALMDSEVDADIKTLSLPASTTISAFGATLVDDADAATARATLGAGTLSNVVEDTTPQLGGTLDAVTNSIENLGAVEEQVNTVATSGATETLDVSLYGVHDITMDQACVFTFSNPAPSGDASSFVLILRGAFTPTFPASVDWPDGSAPTYTTPTVFVFTTVDAGTTWLGFSPGKAIA